MHSCRLAAASDRVAEDIPYILPSAYGAAVDAFSQFEAAPHAYSRHARAPLPSRLPCHRARMADLACPRHLIEATAITAKALPASAPAPLPDQWLSVSSYSSSFSRPSGRSL
eukprot:4482911-Pleurochrysis_carterae.AAC.1